MKTDELIRGLAAQQMLRAGVARTVADEAFEVAGDATTDLAALTAVVATKAPLASPALTDVPTAPTAAPGTNSTQIATTAFNAAAIVALQAAIQAALDAKQNLDATLDALSLLNATAGLIEQTGADAFTKRLIGVGAATSILTRGDGDGRYALTAHSHAIGDVTGLQTALDLKAPLASPPLTGVPTGPTAAAADNSTQLATTAFIQTAISNLIAMAPGTLDTLDELANALGDDPNFATTVTTNLAAKLVKSANLSDLANTATARTNLVLGNVDNTSDAGKPVSTAQQTALDLKLNISAYTAADVLAKLLTVDGPGSGLDADLLDGNNSAFFLAASAYTAADVFAKVLTLDGAGSGLDADTLDGSSIAAFGLLAVDNAWSAYQRFTAGARVEGSSSPASGAGIEFSYTGGAGAIYAYDRTGGAYKPMTYGGLTVKLQVNGGLPANHANDAAAAIGGVGVGELYRTGSLLAVRAA